MDIRGAEEEFQKFGQYKLHAYSRPFISIPAASTSYVMDFPHDDKCFKELVP
jgi:hypothetical protein